MTCPSNKMIFVFYLLPSLQWFYMVYVIPMTIIHILLGQPLLYDWDVTYILSCLVKRTLFWNQLVWNQWRNIERPKNVVKTQSNLCLFVCLFQEDSAKDCKKHRFVCFSSKGKLRSN